MTKESVATTTPAPLEETLEGMRRLLPGAFSEGKVDCDKLRGALGEAVGSGPERFSFSWAGKQDAIRLLQVPSRASLSPSPDESVAFDDTSHLFIEGDNLEVLKLLYRPYFGRVKMIYIDPPYNTGNDFIYPDDFSDPLARYLELTGQTDVEGNLLTSNPESSGRFHSAWLTMMYPRLFIARQMLSQNGAIYVTIGEQESHHLRLLMDEVFGEENFIASVAWEKRITPDNRSSMSVIHDNVLLYARDLSTYSNEEHLLPLTEQARARYRNPDSDPRGDWLSVPAIAQAGHGTRSQFYTLVTPDGRRIDPPEGSCWRYTEEKMKQEIRSGNIWFGKDGTGAPRIKRFFTDSKQGIVPSSIWRAKDVGANESAKKYLQELFDGSVVFDSPKPVGLIRRMLEITFRGEQDGMVLDFFAGSGTTADAVFQHNAANGTRLKSVSVQLAEPIDGSTPTGRTALALGLRTVADIGKERLRRVATASSAPTSGQLELDISQEPADLGFRVFKLRPSSYRQWDGVAHQDPEAYTEQMAVFTDPLVDGWKPEDVLWEVALKEGFSLSSRVDAVDVPSNQVWRITDEAAGRHLLICLDDDLHSDTPASLALSEDDLFVCRDIALTDELAANLALRCRLKTI